MFGLFGKKKAVVELQARDIALQSIVPVVKAIEFEGGASTIELPKEDEPISRPFVADLMILYAEDKPSHFEFISSRRLAELGLTEDELHAQALENLPSRPPKIELHGSARSRCLSLVEILKQLCCCTMRYGIKLRMKSKASCWRSRPLGTCFL